MKRVGVTGAAGFVGSHLVGRLLDDGVEVVGIDDLSYGAMSNLAPYLESRSFHFEKLDCTKVRLLRKAFDGCDAIVHLAAKKIPRFGGTLSTLEVNVAGVNAACSVALALDADIIVTSTSDVYGNGTPPYAEDDPLVIGPPTSQRWAYAVSKMYDEHVALALAKERGLRTTILRLFNAYGPNNNRSWWGGPTCTFIEALLDGEAMEIHGDGQQTRTFTYVSDTVEGFMRALNTPAARGEVINIGGTQTKSIQQLAALIQSKMGFSGPLRATFVPYEALPGNYQDVRDRVPDTRKAKALLGFKAKVSLDDGIEQTITWHAQQRRAHAASS
ncbi:MAG TPA: NAD-dependent epimerase/dehydratase family protein [Gaiellaceae bacterium]|nr:NAD-dependent epimerase/dehydratase family protein [Gaiellaceae bacterium]